MLITGLKASSGKVSVTIGARFYCGVSTVVWLKTIGSTELATTATGGFFSGSLAGFITDDR